MKPTPNSVKIESFQNPVKWIDEFHRREAQRNLQKKWINKWNLYKANQRSNNQ